MHLARISVSFVLLCIAVLVLSVGNGWRNIAALVLTLFALVIAVVLTGCGVKTYEQKLGDCAIDAGTWSQVEDCQQTVECEYHTAACGLRLR